MAALARMRPRDRGTIVQVGSALGERSIPLQSAYCGAKHAINGFTESLRTELLHERQQRPHHGGADARGQHPAVLLGAVPAAPAPAAGAADLPARGGRPRASSTPPTTRGASSTGSAPAPSATLLGQKLAPALLDRYLARTGYDSQQTGEPRPADRPHNLWEPRRRAGGHDHGAHGAFDRPCPSPQRTALADPPRARAGRGGGRHHRSRRRRGAGCAAAPQASSGRAGTAVAPQVSSCRAGTAGEYAVARWAGRAAVAVLAARRG